MRDVRIENVHKMPQQPLCVVLMHPYSLMGGSQMNTLGLAKQLHQVGVPAISFDARGSGDSSGSGTLFQNREVDDTVAVWQATFSPS